MDWKIKTKILYFKHKFDNINFEFFDAFNFNPF